MCLLFQEFHEKQIQTKSTDITMTADQLRSQKMTEDPPV